MVRLFILVLISLAFGQQTICERYAKALGVTHENLMKTIVNEVVAQELASPVIKPFFDGRLPAGSTDFTATSNKAAFDKLAAGLVAFFGGALGCSEAGFPKYTGADMETVHAKMPIGRTEFDTFNDAFDAALVKLKVNATDRTAIRGFLDSNAGAIVNPKIICAKYAKALGVTQIKLMTDIVTKVVGAEVANPAILPFFNGVSPPGSKNIVGSTAEVNRVAGGLIAFFGGVLGCTEAGFPKYGGADMKSVHAKMPIGRKEFDTFNNIFITTIAGMGVDKGDQTTIRSILDSTAAQIVNPATICPKYAKALGVTQIKLMTDIVTKVVGAEVADPMILPFFNGVSPPGSKNIVGSTTEVNRVAGGLIAFFGGALGCTEAGFPKYGGADMRSVHAKMPITPEALTKFNDIFITTLASLGVEIEDRLTVRSLLDSFNSAIINPGYICPKYAKALGLTQVNLMTTIVNAVVGAEVADPSIKVFFDGTQPRGSKNILGSTAEVNRVANGLVAFFGGALGCNEAGFPKYTGAALRPLHQPMKISVANFNKFNDIFIQTLGTLGVTTTDQMVVRSLLDSTKSDIVENTGPSPAPGTGGEGDPDLVAAGYTFNQNLDCGIAVYWMPVDTGVAPAQQVVKFAVRRKTIGWVALGFPENNAFQMIGSDAVIGWIRGDGSVSVNPYHLEAKAVDNIASNSKLSITETSATEVDGVTTIYFTRPLAAGYNPIIDLTRVTVIASTHDDQDELIQHSCRVSQAFELDLETGSGATGSGDSANQRLRNAHGALMILGWGAFLVIGVLVARYGRGSLSNGLWFKVHQALQIFGMCMTTAGFIIALVMVDGVHFNTAFHGQLGVTIMALAYIQMLGGFLRPHKVEGTDATGLRKIFEILHPNIGRLLLIMACVNIFAGIQTLPWHWWVHIVYGITVGFFLLVIIGGEVSGAAKDNGGSSGPDYYAMN